MFSKNLRLNRPLIPNESSQESCRDAGANLKFLSPLLNKYVVQFSPPEWLEHRKRWFRSCVGCHSCNSGKSDFSLSLCDERSGHCKTGNRASYAAREIVASSVWYFRLVYSVLEYFALPRKDRGR